MKKIVMLALVSFGALAACNKPSESDCKKAIANIRLLLGTDKLTEDTGQSAAWVRSCQGSAKKSSVKCAMEASTVDQLKRCGLIKAEDFEEPAAGSAPGSAAGSAPGSAAGSAPGSAAGSAPGSAAGSAPGSAAGSAPGSAAGSAPQ